MKSCAQRQVTDISPNHLPQSRDWGHLCTIAKAHHELRTSERNWNSDYYNYPEFLRHNVDRLRFQWRHDEARLTPRYPDAVINRAMAVPPLDEWAEGVRAISYLPLDKYPKLYAYKGKFPEPI